MHTPDARERSGRRRLLVAGDGGIHSEHEVRLVAWRPLLGVLEVHAVGVDAHSEVQLVGGLRLRHVHDVRVEHKQRADLDGSQEAEVVDGEQPHVPLAVRSGTGGRELCGLQHDEAAKHAVEEVALFGMAREAALHPRLADRRRCCAVLAGNTLKLLRATCVDAEATERPVVQVGEKQAMHLFNLGASRRRERRVQETLAHLCALGAVLKHLTLERCGRLEFAHVKRAEVLR